MQHEGPAIPERTSSKTAIEAQRLKLSQSRSDLKRRLSQTSFKDGLIRYQRLKVEDLELQRDEWRLKGKSLDVEFEQHLLSFDQHRKAQRDINVRIASLGDQLWKQQERLREQEEKENQVPPLGPDSNHAFVATLLALYKGPHEKRKRSKKVQTQLKRSSIATYNADQGAPQNELWCCVTRGYHHEPYVRASHIVPWTLDPAVVDYIFGYGSAARMDTPDNCLLLHEYIERAFDNGNLVLLPVDANERPLRRWKVQVTNDSAWNRKIFSPMTLGDLNGRELAFKNDARPGARFLYYHFVMTLLRNKTNRQPGWEKYCVQLPTGRPFATMGRYMRHSMLLALAKSAGDLSPEAEEEVRLLNGGGGLTFQEPQKLAEVEENEVARRTMQVHDSEDEQEEGVSEEDESSSDDD